MRTISIEKNSPLYNFFLSSWHPYVWLAIIASLPYLRILTFTQFTHYDDYFLIVESYSHIDTLSKIGHAFFEDVSHQAQGGNLYRPLLTISLIVSAQISGMMPLGFHLLDIVLHCASCCLLFSGLQLFGFRRGSSFVGTLFFCVHPAVTQAVAWIPGRNDSLLAVFILLCFISFIKFLSTSRMKWYCIHLLVFMLAMLTKETSIVFPLFALLHVYHLRGKEIFSYTTVLFLVGWAIVLLNWSLLRSAAMITHVGDKVLAVQLVLSNFPIALYYLGNIFWPFDLAFAPISSDIHFAAGIISGGLLVLVLLLAERRDWKMIFFGAAWFVVFLAPTFYYDVTVHLPPKFYEHRIYVPLMGILFILLSVSSSRYEQFFKPIFPYAVCIILAALGWASFTHTVDFKNSLALNEFDASTSPRDPRRYNDIFRMSIPQHLRQEIHRVHGDSLERFNGNRTLSKESLWIILENLKNELKSNQSDPEVLHALAVASFARGFFLSSENYFLSARRENPHDATIPYNLGILYYSGYAGVNAQRAWYDALQLDPAMGNAHINLSFYYYEVGQYALAWDHCQKAIQLGIDVPSTFVLELKRMAS
jgi:protein O-mannosyl-transferase